MKNDHWTACWRALGVVTLILGLSACKGSLEFVGDPDAPPFSDGLRPQIQALMSDLMVSAAVVVVRSPQGDWSAAFGQRARGGIDPLRVDDHFRVGSVTKTWTGTVILQLVHERRIGLDDPVSLHLSGVPDGDRITIRHLLSMRSGLFNYSTDLAFNQSLDERPERVFTVQELLDIGFAHPPYFAPGADYTYSNTNTLLLGQIIESKTGMPLADAFHSRLFAPIGLSRTLYPPMNNTNLPAPFARGYQYGTNVETMLSEALSPERQAAARNGSLQPTDTTLHSTSWGGAAGMGISTAPEMATFVKAMISGGLLDTQLQAQRLASCQPIVPGSPDSASYCLGLAKFGTYYGHTGEIPGYNTFMGYDPTTDTTLVVMASMAAAPDGRAPANTIAMRVMQRLAE